jgi:hypothetical protein
MSHELRKAGIRLDHNYGATKPLRLPGDADEERRF